MPGDWLGNAMVAPVPDIEPVTDIDFFRFPAADEGVEPGIVSSSCPPPSYVADPGADRVRTAGFATIVLSAAVKSLPGELIEAAHVDGAPRWQAFRHITLPQLRPARAVVATALAITALKAEPSIGRRLGVCTQGGTKPPAASARAAAATVRRSCSEGQPASVRSRSCISHAWSSTW